MRNYSQVSPKFWIGATGRKLRKQGTESLIVGMYLLTSPESNMLGLYGILRSTIAHQTGLSLQGALKGLAGCIEAGFCAYDDDAEMVWVYEMASFQIDAQLKPADNRVTGIQNMYQDLPENEHLRGFFDRYVTSFHMKNRRDFGSGWEAPSKTLLSQEQEQEQEQKQDKSNPQASKKPADPRIPEVFDFWKLTMKSAKSALDKNRYGLIERALANYSMDEVIAAIRGCGKTPHNMGVNDRNTKYNGLNLILRSAEKIDYFINLDRAQGKSGRKETIDEANARIMREVNQGKPGGTGKQDDDSNTLEMAP